VKKLFLFKNLTLEVTPRICELNLHAAPIAAFRHFEEVNHYIENLIFRNKTVVTLE
jgi:hypothetical protein